MNTDGKSIAERHGLNDFPPVDHREAISTTVRVDTQAIQAGVTAAKAELAEIQGIKRDGGIQHQSIADVVKESLQDWCRQLDQLEELRTSITKPMNDAKRKVDALFAPGKQELTTLISAGKELLGAWAVVLAKRQQEALAIAAEAATQGDVPVLTGALNLANAPAAPSKGVPIKARWVARVVKVLDLPMRFQRTVADEEAIALYVSRYEPHQVPDPVKGLAFELVGGVTRVSR